MADEIIVTPATSEPVSLVEFDGHLRALGHEQDPDSVSYLLTARKRAEDRIGQQFMTATWRKSFDGFPLWLILLPRPPVQSITSIVYLDTDGNQQTVDPSIYLLDADSRPARLTPAYNCVWPPFRFQLNCMTITWVSGYTSAALVPPTIKHAIKMYAAYLFEIRDISAPMPQQVEDLLDLEWQGRGTPNQMAYGYGFV